MIPKDKKMQVLFNYLHSKDFQFYTFLTDIMSLLTPEEQIKILFTKTKDQNITILDKILWKNKDIKFLFHFFFYNLSKDAKLQCFLKSDLLHICFEEWGLGPNYVFECKPSLLPEEIAKCLLVRNNLGFTILHITLNKGDLNKFKELCLMIQKNALSECLLVTDNNGKSVLDLLIEKYPNEAKQFIKNTLPETDLNKQLILSKIEKCISLQQQNNKEMKQ